MSDRNEKPIVFDDENPEWTEEDFASAKPLSAYPDLGEAMKRARGGPIMAAEDRKQKVNVRLSPDVLAALRAGGRGWQTRADMLLRRALGLEAR